MSVKLRVRFPVVALLGAAMLLTTAACSRSAPARVSVGPEPVATPVEPREQTADQQVRHVLNRLSFGARPGDIEQVRRLGVDRWIEQQLHPESIPDTAADRFFADFVILRQPASALFLANLAPNIAEVHRFRGASAVISSDDSVKMRALAKQATEGRARVQAEVQGGRVARAVITERQLQEVMTDFWLNHFSVSLNKYAIALYGLPDYENRVVRPNALGKFRTLLGAVAKSPTMTLYLDIVRNSAAADRPHLPADLPPVLAGIVFDSLISPANLFELPRRVRPFPAGVTPALAMRMFTLPDGKGLNENYGRELLELHTLGADGGYTQQDVLNAARAFTGWDLINQRLGADGFVFIPGKHDAGEKVFLGHVLPPGRGADDGEEVLDILSRHPSTAHYIAFKLARRFVSDKPPEALVTRAAETFRRTDGDIREVVRAIITSPEFFASAAYKSKVKSPFEAVASALRALGAQPDSTRALAQVVATLGEPIYMRPTPDGWPETGGAWMNTGAILNRINFGTLVASDGLPGVSATRWPGAEKLRSLPLEQQVDGVIAAVLGGEASPDTHAILMRGENPFGKTAASTDTAGAKTKTGSMAVADPDAGRMTRSPPRALGSLGVGLLPQPKGLAQLVGLAIGSPEFQRR